MLSDGVPTFSYAIQKSWIENTSNLDSYGNGYETPTRVPSDQFRYDTIVGYGSSLRSIYSSNIYYNHGNSAIAEAGFAKAGMPGGSPNGIYSIALAAGTNGTQILQDISSGLGYFKSTFDPEDLGPIFQEIAGQISAAIRQATITDPMGAGFAVLGDVNNIEVSPNGGTVDLIVSPLEPTKIEWKVNELIQVVPNSEQPDPDNPDPRLKYAQIKYRIEINDDILGIEPPPTDGLYSTNGPTSISYIDSDENPQTGEFPMTRRSTLSRSPPGLWAACWKPASPLRRTACPLPGTSSLSTRKRRRPPGTTSIRPSGCSWAGWA